MTIELLLGHLRANPDFDEWASLGNIRAAYDTNQPELVLLNYTHEAMSKGEWNSVDMVCRGLILNRQTASVVARPFDKFFNYGERFPAKNAQITGVYEKLDGSLGIGYYHNGKWRMASRGSLTGDHALWGQTQLDKMNVDIATGITLLFEMIMPPETGLQDALIVKYDWSGLAHIGSRRIEQGYLIPPSRLLSGLGRLPTRYHIEAIPDLLERAAQDTNFEGYVVWYNDDNLFKVKTPDYLKQVHLNQHFSQKIVLQAHIRGDAQYFKKLPDDVMPQVNEWLAELQAKTDSTLQIAQTIVESQLAHLPTRKEQAQAVLEMDKFMQPILFKLLDKKPVSDLIQKQLVAEWMEE